MNFDFIEVFTRAAKITWKYKVLWVFGILASCGRGSGGNSNYQGNQSGSGIAENPLDPEMTRKAEAFFEQLGNWFKQNTWVIYAAIALFVLLIVLQTFLNIVGAAGLARGVVRVEGGAESLPFGELFSESLRYFWRLLGAGLIIWLPFFVIFVLIFVAMMIAVFSDAGNSPAMGGAFLLVIISMCCCMLPFTIVLGLYSQQVNRSITVEDRRVIDSLARGWQVFSKNIVILLIIAVVIFIGGFLVGVIIALPVILLMVPLMESFVRGNITSWQPFMAVGVFILCYSPLAWLISGILTTFTESVWTLTYLRLIKPKEEAPVFIEANA